MNLRICCYCAGLKFLVRICTDLGLKDAQDYANKLKKAEKTAKIREEVSDLQLTLSSIRLWCMFLYKFKLIYIVV